MVKYYRAKVDDLLSRPIIYKSELKFSNVPDGPRYYHYEYVNDLGCWFCYGHFYSDLITLYGCIEITEEEAFLELL